MLGLKRTSVLLEDHCTRWSALFNDEKKILTSLLSEYIVSIEPVGSTAVPGLKAKPVIDIAIGLISFETISDVLGVLVSNGYEHRPLNGSAGRYVFVRGPCERRTHHLHVEEYGGEAWNDHIDFRNCLRRYPALCKQYETLKIRLSEAYPDDRDSYTAQKADFIQQVLKNYRLTLKEPGEGE